MKNWLIQIPENILGVLVSSVLFYLIIMMMSRIMGLRSFSALSSFDFLITLAMGALLATTIVSKEVSVAQGTTALITLFILQRLFSLARIKWKWFRKYFDNQPLLLMDGPYLLRKNMDKARITEDELKSKLRAHNINSYSQIIAVVLERSGNISVLYKTGNQQELDPNILEGVRREI